MSDVWMLLLTAALFAMLAGLARLCEAVRPR